MMRRIQAIELHEQPYCPRAVRDGATDCLRFAATFGRQYQHSAPLIVDALRAVNSNQIVDLCSGGGGPWSTLIEQVNRQHTCHVLLTDLYPSASVAHPDAVVENISVVTEPVDALSVPEQLAGLRTLFTALHHFTPWQIKHMLADAVAKGQPIAMFEQTRRVWWALPIMLALIPAAFIASPFIQPFRWSRLFWTYIIPAVPFVLGFDGIVSCFRTYSLEEMSALAAQADPENRFDWRIGRLRSPLSPLGVQYMIGLP